MVKSIYAVEKSLLGILVSCKYDANLMQGRFMLIKTAGIPAVCLRLYNRKNNRRITMRRNKKAKRRLIRAAGLMLSAVLLCGTYGAPVSAGTLSGAGQSYEPVTETEGNEEDYIAVTSEERTYSVIKGDCLWNIALKKLGDGSLYQGIADRNQISDPNLIFPGQELVLDGVQTLYIPRQKNSLGGMEYKGIFQFDYPKGLYMSSTSLDSHLSSLSPHGSETEILFDIARSSRERNEFSDSWEEFCENITRRGNEILGDDMEDISFEKYTLENGDDVYFYSFKLTDSEGRRWTESVGYRLGGELQAEFIGISRDYPIEDVVRYMTAAFEEQATEDSAKDFSLWGGGTVSYMASDYWDYEGFHNAFAVGYRKVNGKQWKPEGAYAQVAADEDYQVEWLNPVLELAVRKYLNNTEETLSASDLEDITYISLVKWAPSDIIYINDEMYSCSFEEIWEKTGQGDLPDNFGELAIEDMKHFVNLEGVTLSLSDLESYGKLGELKQIKSLSLSRDIYDRSSQLTDISFLGEMESLEQLFLEKAFDEVLDWSVLEKCPNLKMVNLCTQADEEKLIFPEGLEVNITDY